ncbi:hypothetical protein PoB_006619700 [Plakobranchus ocellatus]|uniref:Uncharacterized protein n=1 Tax=Plakobranchus ocellatus TaxID=259542 RepID=A0AAV4D662_9GAST|nr:hypothetical protein PoB_006619700 [Plakobranchus ocellatus]
MSNVNGLRLNFTSGADGNSRPSSGLAGKTLIFPSVPCHSRCPSVFPKHSLAYWGIGGTVASESALRSAGTFLSRVRAQPPAPWPDGGPESLRSPCCGLAIYKKPNL